MQHLVLNLDRSVNVDDSDDLGETYTGNLPTYGENDRIDVAGDFVLITNSWRGTIHLLREVPTGYRAQVAPKDDALAAARPAPLAALSPPAPPNRRTDRRGPTL